MVGRICDIPILPHGPSDRVVWFHNVHGIYTTKLAYFWLLLKSIGYGQHRFFWKLFWKLRVLPKLHVFAWQIGNELLSKNSKILAIKYNVVRECSRCRGGDETLIQALKNCPKARDVLIMGGIDNRLLNKKYELYIDCLKDSMRLLDKKAFEDFISTLWNIWNDRNNAIFRGKKEDARMIWERAHDFLLCGRAIFIDKAANPKWAKLDALLVGIQLTQPLNLDKVIFKADCACTVTRLCKHKDDITIFGYRIKKVREMFDSFSKAKVKWVNRWGNKATDFLCKWSSSNYCNMLFEIDYPSDIHNLVIVDAI
ncbi:hypothetical protein Gorai_019355 [Gossypium raimondii]|uniref:Reverse transcriptase zinc-binding domain-containing protein n=1 Tax=Gossypium raimondii TaxID=29730 RepID=A0A7J8PN03_GOSRA|nr:hypothetical protein [Gossypium raimondii]